MTMRGLGAALALALVGIAAGFAAGNFLQADPNSVYVAAPVAAESPAFPIESEEPYAPDIDFPALSPNLSYREQMLGNAPFQWTYEAPRAWLISQIQADEFKVAPVANPLGGYGLRLKLVTERKTTQQMVDQKLAALEQIAADGGDVTDIHVLSQSSDTLAISYRALPQNWLRYNTFRWFSPTGSITAEVEVSVNGREVDVAGLTDLLDQVSASIRQVD